ncbi:MAG: ribose import ATP-binding protein RbsA [Planctomycetaceae bacterium]|nr:MAG: ribose import ATP-binding protein RbsA [Planctomycetaceae bacterium]
MNAPLIQFRNVSKRFDAVQALDQVTFSVSAGEIHALCGENGAGKSTLMKILSGVITQYAGEILLAGSPLKLRGPRDAEEHGISIIHQELNLVNDLSVAANLFLGREWRNRWGWLDDRGMERSATEWFQQLECQIHPRDIVRSLRIGDQQLVEIARALSLQARIVIMDEPTSALTEGEVARLFRVIDRLREQRVTILYISHKMDEVFRLADRITVLRDGKVVKTLNRRDTTPAEITSLMVGRDVDTSQFRTTCTRGEEVLRVEKLSLPWAGRAQRWRLFQIDLTVRAGEVLGVAGLMGAGRTELLECLYGASALHPSGTIRFLGRVVNFRHPRQALAAGIAMVTEDRKRYGLIPSMNVREHITLSELPNLTRGGLISAASESSAARQSIQQLRIKAAGTEARITSLSGGNQQKCLIARALRTHPRLLLLDDPTRGIDVGAKAEIYRLIDELCHQGMAIILTSSELPELMTLSDRIIVLSEGRKTAELTRTEFTEERLMHAMTGQIDLNPFNHTR